MEGLACSKEAVQSGRVGSLDAPCDLDGVTPSPSSSPLCGHVRYSLA